MTDRSIESLVKVGTHWIDPVEVAAIRTVPGRAVAVVLRGSGAELEMFPADADAVYEALSAKKVTDD